MPDAAGGGGRFEGSCPYRFPANGCKRVDRNSGVDIPNEEGFYPDG